MGAKPGQDIAGEVAAMGACFNNLDRTRPGLALQKPLGKLKREQLTEKFSDANTGVKVAGPTNPVLFLFIKSINRTIKGQAHKFFEGNGPSFPDLAGNYFEQLSQRFGELVRI